jgi:hypothetical protein
MNRLRWACASGVALAFLVVSAPAAPAAEDSGPPAARSWSDCPVGWFCVWTNAGGLGLFAQFRDRADELNNIEGWDFNNKISSVRNRTNAYWCVSDWPRHGGGRLEVWPGEVINNLSDVGWNDRISSLKVGSC